MNECALGNGGCAHRCVNSAGSFGCECNTGYVLLSDGKSCGEESKSVHVHMTAFLTPWPDKV